MTITKGAGPVYHVTGNQLHLVEKHLDRAVEMAVQQAIESGGRHGILVTRHGPGSFTVAVSDEVPYRTTQERESHSRLHRPAVSLSHGRDEPGSVAPLPAEPSTARRCPAYLNS